MKWVTRNESHWGSRLAPFHGLGWLEGYIEIIHQFLKEAAGQKSNVYPTLPESLKNIEVLLRAHIVKHF